MKKNITLIAIATAVLIGFGYFTLFSSPANNAANQLAKGQEDLSSQNESRSSEETELKSGVDTLNNLRLLNEDLECTISLDQTDSSTKVEGTYFVSDGNMRGDFLTDSPDLTDKVLTSTIVNKDAVYIWSEIEGEMYGVKMLLADAEKGVSQKNESLSINDRVQYDCTRWKNVDGSVFVPPGNVLFRDMNELIKTGMEYGTVYEEGSPN